MAEIEGGGSFPKINEAQRKMYEQEYKNGALLFQQALDQYAKSDSMYQREEFKEVMNRAMDILNEAARGLKNQQLEKFNSKISSDYQAFQKGESPRDQAALNSDLEKARKSL